MSWLHRLQAPREPNTVLADPPVTAAAVLVEGNRRLFAEGEATILGRALAELRIQARTTAVAVAREYLQQANQPVPPSPPDSVFVAGHQPELFHPGVWVKNFALHGLAHLHESFPLNLIVDSDNTKNTSLRMPAWREDDPGSAHLVQVPFDVVQAEVPHEERHVHDEQMFAGLPGRARPWMKNWPFEPILPAFWKEVLEQARRTPLLGERLAGARRAMERQWGCANGEVPMSRLCQTEPFAWFAGHILENLAEFHTIFNRVVNAFRRRYRVRSRNHPMPDLGRDGDWLEGPFWIWKAGQPRRQPLFVRRDGPRLWLRGGRGSEPIGLPREKAADLVASWLGLEGRGIKIRTRAATTTLFARLFLADLFIHGIGGGKYDEVTDDLVRSFYRMEPPGFMVLSATMVFPFPDPDRGPEDCRRLARLARDLAFNPQRHLDGKVLADAASLVAEKQAWIDRPCADRQERRQRFWMIRALNEKLRPFLDGKDQLTREDEARCRRIVEADRIFHGRDFPFCLYPGEDLRRFCTSFLFLPSGC